MQNKPLDKIIDSLGGKKKGRKRKKETTPTPMSEVEFFNAIQFTSKSRGFDQEKLESVSETKEVSYEKDFNELKDMVQKVLSKNTPKDTKFKKIDPRDIKKLDKYTFKTAVIKTEKGMTQLPALRTGGIVTSPTQALIGENGPEAVIPLERLRSLYNQMPMSREGFGTMARNLMPNADEIQISSMFRQVSNPSPSSDMDSYNPVLAMDLRDRYGPGGVPRPENQESQQEFRARLDKIAPTAPGLLKTPGQVESERFSSKIQDRKDRADIQVLITQAERFPDRAEQILKTAEKVNPEMYLQMQRDRRSAKLDRRAEERMKSVGEPGKDLRAGREKMFADREKEAAEKEKKVKARQKRLAGLYQKHEEGRIQITRRAGDRPEKLTSGAGGFSYNELMDSDYFKNKYSEEENKKITDRAAERRRITKQIADESVDAELKERYKTMELDPAKTFGDAFEFGGKLLGGLGETVGALFGGTKRNEPVFKGPDVNPATFSQNVTALQELQEKYRNSQSGREQTSQAHTPRVKPSNPAKVKTPHATGLGGGGGGQTMFDMIGMANKMFPIWRIGNG
jgi:hypothetical protein